MYCEYLLKEIKDGVTSSKEQFFLANYSVLYCFAKDFHVRTWDYEDFFQLCYIAFEKAVESYSLHSVNSFLSYYRRCAMHQYFLYKLEMHFPIKIPKELYKQVSIDDTITTVPFDSTYLELDDCLLEVEKSLIKETIWTEVFKILGKSDTEFIYCRFVKGMSYIEFSQMEKFKNMSNLQLRSKQSYLLRKLRRSDALKIIATSFYGIKIIKQKNNTP